MTGSAVFYLQFTEMEPIIHMLCKIIWNKGLNLGAQCRSCNSNLLGSGIYKEDDTSRSEVLGRLLTTAVQGFKISYGLAAQYFCDTHELEPFS